jgi:hypothetical protein
MGITFAGDDAGGSRRNYGLIGYTIADNTDTSLDGTLQIQQMIANTMTDVITATAGAVALGPTAGEITHTIQATNPTNETPVLKVENRAGTVGATEEILRLNWAGTGIPTTGAYFQTFRRNGTISGSVTVNSTGVLFNTSSDARLKTKVGVVQNALSRVLSVDAVEFTWNETGAREEGFFAQEMHSILPSAVHAPEDGYWAIDYGRVTPLLWRAVQELSVKLDAAEARIAQLESK